mgnify:CR=1 FL=1
MSYDIELKDPVTKETIEIVDAHFMQGGTYQIGGTNQLWLNITYNYSHYYYEATDGDPRFAHDEVSCVYADGREGPIETRYGIRGIYGKTGAESVPMLEDMIERIKEKYQKNGSWISTKRKVMKYYDECGTEIDFGDYLDNSLHHRGKGFSKREEEIIVNEGPNSNYWQDTAANAIRPLLQLIAFAKMRPDGIWDGD